jgi:hypothetical protein
MAGSNEHPHGCPCSLHIMRALKGNTSLSQGCGIQNSSPSLWGSYLVGLILTRFGLLERTRKGQAGRGEGCSVRPFSSCRSLADFPFSFNGYESHMSNKVVSRFRGRANMI